MLALPHELFNVFSILFHVKVCRGYVELPKNVKE